MLRWLLVLFLVLIAGIAPLRAQNPEVAEWLRSQLATIPVLPASTEAGTANFTAMRLNTGTLVYKGERYGAVRIQVPAGLPMDLVWLFSDLPNIDEYDFVPIAAGGVSLPSIRQIYPATASLDLDEESPKGRRLGSLPRPWDLFELHLLGFPANLLTPGQEYLVWFHFTDHRPTDVLMAVTLVAPLEKMRERDLPGIVGLPNLLEP